LQFFGPPSEFFLPVFFQKKVFLMTFDIKNHENHDIWYQ